MSRIKYTYNQLLLPYSTLFPRKIKESHCISFRSFNKRHPFRMVLQSQVLSRVGEGAQKGRPEAAPGTRGLGCPSAWRTRDPSSSLAPAGPWPPFSVPPPPRPAFPAPVLAGLRPGAAGVGRHLWTRRVPFSGRACRPPEPLSTPRAAPSRPRGVRAVGGWERRRDGEGWGGAGRRAECQDGVALGAVPDPGAGRETTAPGRAGASPLGRSGSSFGDPGAGRERG